MYAPLAGQAPVVRSGRLAELLSGQLAGLAGWSAGCVCWLKWLVGWSGSLAGWAELAAWPGWLAGWTGWLAGWVANWAGLAGWPGWLAGLLAWLAGRPRLRTQSFGRGAQSGAQSVDPIFGVSPPNSGPNLFGNVFVISQ